MPTKKILIIEDEEFLSEMYKIKFEQEGYEAIVADNGPDGIEAAKKEKPDLILLDLLLPKMDGYEVLKKLKLDKDTKNIKVYILSNLGQNGEINKGFADGADGYLIKANLTPSQLVRNVEKIFSGEKVGMKSRAVKENVNDIEGDDVKSENVKKDKNKSILLIEDEEVIINMYKLSLVKEGYKVRAAKNGAWGLKLAREEEFDVIVMDIIMPAMDGCDAIAKLKSDEKTKNIPIIVLSNSAQEKDIEEAKKCGAACYLLKSRITPAKLVKEIEKVLEK